MILIQLILIAAIATIGVLALWSLRSQRLSRFVVLALAAAGVAFVLRPDFTSRIAHFLGVGRGVDLMLYIFLVATIYALLQLYARVRTLDWQITQLSRALAIANVRKLEQ
jgi:small membrane protein